MYSMRSNDNAHFRCAPVSTVTLVCEGEAAVTTISLKRPRYCISSPQRIAAFQVSTHCNRVFLEITTFACQFFKDVRFFFPMFGFCVST